jgi:predicted DsbA family dithiol-disulfide isomerase
MFYSNPWNIEEDENWNKRGGSLPIKVKYKSDEFWCPFCFDGKKKVYTLIIEKEGKMDCKIHGKLPINKGMRERMEEIKKIV